jgi:4-hydroxybenzoate polyprenyltransferase
LSMGSMIAAGILTDRRIFYWLSLVCIGKIFIYQQKLARNKDMPLAVKSFFKVNMFVSPILFLGTFIEVYLF